MITNCAGKDGVALISPCCNASMGWDTQKKYNICDKCMNEVKNEVKKGMKKFEAVFSVVYEIHAENEAEATKEAEKIFMADVDNRHRIIEIFNIEVKGMDNERI